LSGPQGDGMKDVLKQLNQNEVLSLMEWTTNFNDSFKPFDGNYDWWTKYNKVKHHLTTDILTIQYSHVVNAIVALVSLQRLAMAKISQNLNGTDLIDISKWDANSKWSYYSSLQNFHTYTGPKS